jgi:predicted signal transduction protein with EAL and GGDEF domain
MVAQRDNLEAVNRETQRLSDANRKLAHHDSLTGLAQPPQLHRPGGSARETPSGRVAVQALHLGIVDLDGFKAVNDLYGHATGDALLIEASRRMAEIAGPRMSCLPVSAAMSSASWPGTGCGPFRALAARSAKSCASPMNWTT